MGKTVFTARLSARYYVLCAFLLCLVVLGWYGIISLNANEIRMEDDTLMDSGTKLLFTILMSLAVSSWTLSLLTLLRQVLLKSAFCIDENGIGNTATAIMFLAFIFVVPVKRIPWDAIQQIETKDDTPVIRIDKSKMETIPILKPLVCREFHFFSKLTKEKTETVQEILHEFMHRT